MSSRLNRLQYRIDHFVNGFAITDHFASGSAIIDHLVNGLAKNDHFVSGFAITDHFVDGLARNDHFVGGFAITGRYTSHIAIVINFFLDIHNNINDNNMITNTCITIAITNNASVTDTISISISISSTNNTINNNIIISNTGISIHHTITNTSKHNIINIDIAIIRKDIDNVIIAHVTITSNMVCLCYS